MSPLAEPWLDILAGYRRRNLIPRASSPQEFVEMLRDGQCPFCPRDGFVMVARHTEAIHGVTAWELRDSGGLLGSDSICDPGFSRARSIEIESKLGEARPRGQGHRSPHVRMTREARRSLEASGRRLASEYLEWRANHEDRVPGINRSISLSKRKRSEGTICAYCGVLFVGISFRDGRIRLGRSRTCSLACRHAYRSQLAKDTLPKWNRHWIGRGA